MSRSFLPALLACAFAASAANAQGRIEGIVRSADRRPQVGATVEVEGLDRSATTDADGRFTFDGMNAGTAVWIYAWLGNLMSPRTAIYLDPDGPTAVELVIEPPPVPRPVEPEVAAEVPLLGSPNGIGRVVVAPEQTAVLPSLGERDALRGLQLLPGVSGSHEGSSAPYLRGGDPSQTLVSYDGMTLYETDRLVHYASPFNMDAVRTVELGRDAFDAAVGGRLSGTLDITGKTGRRDRPGLRVGGDFLSIHGVAEMPLGRRVSLLVAGRHSLNGPLYADVRGLLGRPSGSIIPRIASWSGFTTRDAARLTLFQNLLPWESYDLNAKLLVETSSSNKLTVSAYRGRDTIDTYRQYEVPDTVRKRITARGTYAPATISASDPRRRTNEALSLQWLRSWGKKVDTRLSVAHSRFEGLADHATLTGGAWIGGGTLEDNTVDDTTARLDLTARLRSNDSLEAGVLATRIDTLYQLETSAIARLVPGVTSTATRPDSGGLLDRDQKTTLYAGYVQNRWTAFRRLTLSPGVRVTRYDLTSETLVEPRLEADLALNKRLRLKGAWGDQHQFVNRIAREDLTVGPRASWMLADGTSVPVARARKVAGGLTYQSDRFLFEAQVFHKSLTGLAELVPSLGWRTSTGPDLAPFFQQGEGTARGGELLIQGQFGHNRGWIAYTLTKVESKFPGLANNAFPADEDQRHGVKIVDTLRIWRATLAGSWIFATGRPSTQDVGVRTETVDGTFAFDDFLVGQRNGGRLRDYHRLDLSAYLDLPLGSTKLVLSGTAFNVYNRRNVDYTVYQLVEGDVFGSDIRLMGRTFNAALSLRF
jgi:ferric enterobactin receptor